MRFHISPTILFLLLTSFTLIGIGCGSPTEEADPPENGGENAAAQTDPTNSTVDTGQPAKPAPKLPASAPGFAKYVKEGFLVAGFARPQPFLDHPIVKKLRETVPDLDRELSKSNKMEEFEAAVVMAGPLLPGMPKRTEENFREAEPGITAMIGIFKEPVDLEETFKEMFFTPSTWNAEKGDYVELDRKPPVETTFQGMKYYSSPDYDLKDEFFLSDRYVYISDDKKIVVQSTSEVVLQRVLDNKVPVSPLATQLADLYGEKEIAMVYQAPKDPNAAIEFVQESFFTTAFGSSSFDEEGNQTFKMTIDRQPIPPQLKSALEVTQGLQVAVDIDKEEMVSASAVTIDAAAATSLKETAESLVGMGRDVGRGAASQFAPMLTTGDPATKETQLLSMLDEGIKGLKISTDGNVINATFAKPAWLDTLPDMVKEMVDAEAERKAQSRGVNNMRQIGIAFYNFENQHTRLPKDITDAEGKPLLSWRVAILPYLEQRNIHDQFNLEEPWDSEWNLKVAENMPKIYEVPGVPKGQTTYMTFAGAGPFGQEGKLRIADIRDGTSNTIMVVEAGTKNAVPWTKPQDLPFDPEGNPWDLLGDPIEFDRILAAMFDGSVHPLNPSEVPAEKLKAKITHNGGEVIED